MFKVSAKWVYSNQDHAIYPLYTPMLFVHVVRHPVAGTNMLETPSRVHLLSLFNIYLLPSIIEQQYFRTTHGGTSLRAASDFLPTMKERDCVRPAYKNNATVTWHVIWIPAAHYRMDDVLTGMSNGGLIYCHCRSQLINAFEQAFSSVPCLRAAFKSFDIQVMLNTLSLLLETDINIERAKHFQTNPLHELAWAMPINAKHILE